MVGLWRMRESDPKKLGRHFLRAVRVQWLAIDVPSAHTCRYLDPLTDRGAAGSLLSSLCGAKSQLSAYSGPADVLETQGPIDVEEVESVQSS